MKKIKTTLFLSIFGLFTFINVDARTLIRESGHQIQLAPKSVTSQINLGSEYGGKRDYTHIAQYYENEIVKYMGNIGPHKWASEYYDIVISEADMNFDLYHAEYEKDGLGTTEQEARNGVLDLFKKNAGNNSMYYAYVPAELSATGPATWGGSLATNNSEISHILQYQTHWYPTILDEVLAIYKDDANGQKINFNNLNGKTKYDNKRIIDNGNVDEDGVYVGLEKLKISKTEYNKIMNGESKLKLYVYGAHSPFAMDTLEFFKEDNTTTSYYITNRAFNSSGVEVPMRSHSTAYYKAYETFSLDKSYIVDNAIYGLYAMQTGTGKVNNDVLNPHITANGLSGIIYYYQFKIELEIIDDGSETITSIETKNDKDIRDNNALIYLEDELINIENKKSWTEGRIYVELDSICNYVNCTYEYDSNNDLYKVNYYPIKNNQNIIYSLTLNENNNVFESVLKINNEVYEFKNKILDASPFRENDKVYVPIRFLLEGLGAKIDYYPTNGTQPEEVRIYFNVDEFVETLLNDEITTENSVNINQNTIEIEQNYILDKSTKNKMNQIKIHIQTNDKNVNICSVETENCDILITENKITIINKELKKFTLYIIGKYNDYPYIKELEVNHY